MQILVPEKLLGCFCCNIYPKSMGSKPEKKDIKKIAALSKTAILFYSGGEEGIRTPVTIAGKHIFETCAIIHSATSPDV